MTRYTNLGLAKRTYVDSGLAEAASAPEPSPTPAENSGTPETGSAPADGPPPKKKRKRLAKSLRDGYIPPEKRPVLNESKARKGRMKKERKAAAAAADAAGPQDDGGRWQPPVDSRREKRIAERSADTTCFACRKRGHAARDCPNEQKKLAEGGPSNTGVVGICYRCGSDRHTLARCHKVLNPEDPFPFASCFVCSSQGHLASACPQNKERGIYPDGGSCKLCGDKTHLAKNCGLRKDEPAPTNSVLLGTGQEAGADEDDFHTFKRKTADLDENDRQTDKIKRTLNVKAGALSGVVKPFGEVPAAPKKVVNF